MSSIIIRTNPYIEDNLAKVIASVADYYGKGYGLDVKKDIVNMPQMAENEDVYNTVASFIEKLKTQNRASYLIRTAYNIKYHYDPQEAQEFLNTYTGLDKPTWDTNAFPQDYEMQLLILDLADAINPVNVAQYVYSAAKRKASYQLGKEEEYK
ncbi:MAG: hypothetical protein C0173_06700 [Desulfurella sp.]|nr:MAG: hypothetical protein C0173_06700 [Desulfurella sp.]